MINRIVLSGWHKWLSLFVGIQLFIWVGTGIYFNQMDAQAASGNLYRKNVSHRGNAPTSAFVPLEKLALDEPVLSAALIWVSGTPLYQVKTENPLHDYAAQQHALFHAVSGLPWSIQPDDVQRIAERSYTGPGKASKAILLNPPFDFDGRQENPLWKVSFDDEIHTDVYLHAETGKVIAHSNDDSRLKHLMLTLHFMDYANTGGFNHTLIVVFAIATLTLTGSGILLAYRRTPNRGVHAKSVTDVRVIHNRGCDTFSLPANQPLFFALSQAGLSVNTECGGGGTCGQCVVQTDNKVVVSDIDRYHLTEDELQQGKRLSCQHVCSEFTSVTLK